MNRGAWKTRQVSAAARPPSHTSPLYAGRRRCQQTFADTGHLQIDKSPALRHSGRMAKPALGRGLVALMGSHAPLTGATPNPVIPPGGMASAPVTAPGERVRRVPLDRLRASALQPRKEFAPEALQELADSIREQGIVQPLIVRERAGFFELIAGERRWRAAQILNLPEVPVIVREADDRTVLELALIENLQRENLNALEEALGYSQLAEQFKLTQEDIALKVGKSRAAVANATRLLKLPAPVQDALRAGRLSVGHAKVILGLADSASQQRAAARVQQAGLNVRQTEALVAAWQTPAATPNLTPPAAPPASDPHLARLEDKLRDKFGAKVRLKYLGGQGAVEIRFFSDDDLQRILDILQLNAD